MDELGMMPLADLKNQKITNPIMSEDFEDDDQTIKALERLREQKAASMVPESFLLDREAYEEWKQSQLISEAEASQKESQRHKQLRIAQVWMSKHKIIAPESALRRQWDAAQIFALFYVAIAVPYRIGFDHDTAPWEFWFLFDIVVDVYFIVDIFINFRTAHYDEHGELVYEPSQIARLYLKTWFSIDAVSCLPVNYLIYIPGLSGAGAASGAKTLRLLRLLRLLKLLRLARLNRLIARYQEEFYALMTSFNILKLIFIMLLLGHWLCCVWFYCGNSDNYVCIDAGQPINANEECDALVAVQPQAPDGTLLRGWVHQHFGGKANDNDKVTFGWKYMMSLYWSMMTMTTVGYGDIAATTESEHIVSLFGMIMGGFVFGLIVGNLGEISRRANPAAKIKDKKISKISSFVHSRGVDQDLCRRVRTYYTFYYNNRTACESLGLFQYLPVPMRNELMVQMGYATGNRAGRAETSFGILHKVPFFTRLDNHSVLQICLRLKMQTFETAIEHRVTGLFNQYIMREGELACEMFIVTDGEVLVESNEESVGTAKKGDFFGELSVLVDRRSMRKPRVYTRSAAAAAECEVASLSQEDVVELLEHNPYIHEAVEPYIARARATESEYSAMMRNIEPSHSGDLRLDIYAETGSVKIGEDSFLSVLGEYSSVTKIAEKAEQQAKRAMTEGMALAEKGVALAEKAGGELTGGGDDGKASPRVGEGERKGSNALQRPPTDEELAQWTTVSMTVEHGVITIRETQPDEGENGEVQQTHNLVGCDYIATDEGHNGEELVFQLELGDSDSKDANSVGTILTFAVNSPAELKKWLRAVAAASKPRIMLESTDGGGDEPAFDLYASGSGGGGSNGADLSAVHSRMDAMQSQLANIERLMKKIAA